MSKKLQLEFEGFEEVVARLEKLGGDVKGVTEEALKKTKRHIHQKLGQEMQPHNETYATVKSLVKESNVEWSGTVASIPTGFSIKNGGLASIFLMYGTPRMNKDQKLYNDIWGNKTKKEIIEIQENIFYEKIRRLNG